MFKNAHKTAIFKHGERASFSPAQQAALLACAKAGSLYREGGVWRGRHSDPPINGVTVADLGRDGLLIVETKLRTPKSPSRGTARLTELGRAMVIGRRGDVG